MKSCRPLTGLLVAATLAGCASAPKQEAPTVATLKNQSIRISQSPAPQTDMSKAIETYRDLLEQGGDGNLGAEAMRRLADIEMQRTEREQEQAGKPDPKAYDKAIQLYQNLLTKYPSYAGREEVLYQLAKAYEASNRTELALGILKRLAVEFPTSPRAAEAHFRRGEVLFLQQRYHEAEQAYASVIGRGTGNKFYEQSLFKYGWSIYKQDRCLESLDSFTAILDGKINSNVPPSSLANLNTLLPRADVELVDDTLRAISLCAAQHDDTRTLRDYFNTRQGRNYEFLVYRRLSELYASQDRISDATRVLRDFGDRNPWHPYAALFVIRTLELLQKGGFRDQLIPARKEYVTRFEAFKNHWENNTHNSYFEYLVRTDDKAKAQMYDQLRIILDELAQYHHAKAQKTGNVTDFQEAQDWYRRYLAYFPDSGGTSYMQFLLAETLFEDKRYKEAAREYERTAYDSGPNAKAAEAGYAALLAYAEHEKLLKGEEKLAWHREAIQSSLRFAKTFPNDPRTPSVLTKMAEEFYRDSNYNDAMATAQTVVDKYPNADADTRRTALTVAAHTQFELQHYEIAELYYLELLAATPKGDKSQQEIQERLAACIYKQAEHMRAEGAIRGAIAEYNRLIETAPDSSVRPIAEYDIATSYIILDEWEQALQLLEKFKREYPKHSLIKDVNEKIAVAYIRLSKPVEAATALESIASTKKDDPDSQRDALWKAAELYEKGGELLKAAVGFVKYADTFPSPLEPALEALNRAAQVYKKMDKEFYYRVQLEKMHLADKNGGAERTPRTRYLGAMSAFELAEPHYKRYAEVKLVEPLRQNMQIKNQYMKQALEAYSSAAEVGIAEFTTAATYRIADMYADFSKQIMASERPASLTPEELEQYNLMLEEQAFPFDEKAIAMHETNILRAKDGIYDEWVKKSYEALAKLFSGRYNKQEKADHVLGILQ